MVNNQSHFMWVLVFGKRCFVTFPFHNLHEQIGQAQLNQRVCHIRRCKISRLLFADDLVLLASLESGLQHALNGFADACDIAGMKISTSKTEVLHLSRNPVQCSLQVGDVPLKQVEKFKYLEVVFTSDERQDKKIGCSVTDLITNHTGFEPISQSYCSEIEQHNSKLRL